ncbi:hypothetical protein [Qipengyuania sp.]|uniref:hypothetical protein n=1 Tax=Qipengyuania sp. TaxID=2004515 RepID=UPI003AF9D9D0
MTGPKSDLRWWLWGLAAFAVVIALSVSITLFGNGVTWGIGEHQAAGSAARVDEIQAQWRAGGVRNLAIVAMLGDLVFIGIYGWGSWRAGRSFMAMPGALGLLGVLIAASAVVFVLCDYTETVLQMIQLLRERGSDAMAGTAAAVRPIKSAAWVATFLGVLAALAIGRLGRPKLD